MHRGVLTILLQIIGDLFQAPAPSLTEMRSMITGRIQSIWYYIFPQHLVAIAENRLNRNVSSSCSYCVVWSGHLVAPSHARWYHTCRQLSKGALNPSFPPSCGE